MSQKTISNISRLRWPRLLQRRTFTPQEVRERLQLDRRTDPRTAAVHAAAAQTGVWSGLLSDETARDLGPAAHRLPTVVYWYSQRVPAHEIGRRLSPFGGPWDADRALTVAAALIAASLNQLTDLAA